MADDELAAIRAARMAQLKAQAGNGTGGLSAPAPSDDKGGASQEMKRSLLYQILSPEARERCNFTKFKK